MFDALAFLILKDLQNISTFLFIFQSCVCFLNRSFGKYNLQLL